MKKFRFGDMWDKIEKYTIYAALIIFAILQLLDTFISSALLDKIVNYSTINMFIAVILLYLFLYIDRRLPLQSKFAKGVKTFNRLDEALNYALPQPESVQQLDLFAHSSDGYYSILRYQFDNMVSLEKIRIVVRNPNSDNFLSHLENKKAAQYEQSQIVNRIDSWQRLAGIEKWKNFKTSKALSGIEIYTYDFDPAFHLLIIDKKILVIGFFKPTQEGWGFAFDNILVISKDNDIGVSFLQEFTEWFDKTISERTNKISVPANTKPTTAE